MKKIIAICIVALTFSFVATAQTTTPAQKKTTKTQKKKTLKYKMIEAVHSKKTEAKLAEIKQQMKKEGE